MDSLMNILTGPVLIFSLAVFFAGLAARFALYFLGLNWKIDRVAYRADMKNGLKGGVHSAVMWLIPFGTYGWRAQPFMTVCFCLLHLGAVLVPLFLLGHNVIFKDTLGFSLFSLPQILMDLLTIMTILGLVLLILRRIVLPEVRKMSGFQDWFLLILVLTVFVTGFMACQQACGYRVWLIGHIISGELLLILAPFTKLSHIALYFASRVQIGMDYAIKRGGNNRNSGALFPW